MLAQPGAPPGTRKGRRTRIYREGPLSRPRVVDGPALAAAPERSVAESNGSVFGRDGRQ